jgi:hypothetical protein
MLQSMSQDQTEVRAGHRSRNEHLPFIYGAGKAVPPAKDPGHEFPALAGDHHAAASPLPGVPLKPARQKTMYKLIDSQSGLYCQGGPWPCAWDSVGKAWPSRTALGRYLRSVLARGYHLKPRAVPPQWRIIEIEEIVSYREKAQFSADALMASH